MSMGRRNAHIRIGGLMRCCTSTIAQDADKAPLEPNIEGEILQCQYTDDPTHRMIYRAGAWEWYRGSDEEPEPELGTAEWLKKVTT